MKNKNAHLALSFLKSHPDRAAAQLESMDGVTASQYLAGLPHTISTPVIERILPQYVARLLMSMEQDKAANILSNLNARKSAAALRYVEKNSRKALIAKLSAKKKALLNLFLNYTEDTIGAWMNPKILTFSDTCTVGEALDQIRKSDGASDYDVFYVVNRELQLQGCVRMSQLLCQPDDTMISVFMKKNGPYILGRMHLISAEHHEGWNDEVVLPVLNRDKQVVGAISHAMLHQGLRHMMRTTKAPQGYDPGTGLWEVYGASMLGLFDAMGGFTGFKQRGQGS